MKWPNRRPASRRGSALQLWSPSTDGASMLLVATFCAAPAYAAEDRSDYDPAADSPPTEPAPSPPIAPPPAAENPATEPVAPPPGAPPAPAENPPTEPAPSPQGAAAPSSESPTSEPTPAVPVAPAPTSETAAGTMPVTDPPAEAPVNLGEAEAAPELSKKQLRLFKPSPGHLPANPRAQVDFTAYTLEFGEVKLGVANIIIGILPHVQVGTSVPLDVLGIPNVHAKVHATEGGPFDIGAIANYHVLERSAFAASFFSAGGIVSVTPVTPWSIHVGGTWTRGDVTGDINFENIYTLLWFLDDAPQGDELANSSLLQVETIDAKIATDIRFNRRDSIVFQAEAMLWSNVQRDEELWIPEFMGLENALAYDGFVPIDEAAVASVAWQFAWEHLEIRVGVGISSIPAAWLLQSTEVSYRFGGKSRTKEKRMREGWFRNRDDLKDGLDESPGTPKK